MLLALFLIATASGLCLFLPLVGRRNAGVKFYRLILLVSGILSVLAGLAHRFAGAPRLTATDLLLGAACAAFWFVLRYPKRIVYWIGSALLGVASLAAPVAAFDAAARPAHAGWSIAGGLSTAALVGSVSLAMLLGHWYLVVRGMPIEPLKRLTIATLVATLVKCVVVTGSLWTLAAQGTGYGSAFHGLLVGQGVFFWMRVGWGLAGPLVLYPMIWGTVRIRSTMAATGILYVAVVAVVIGEVLGAWLSAALHLVL